MMQVQVPGRTEDSSKAAANCNFHQGISQTRSSYNPVQAKLTINQPNDAYEEEADQVAAHVMRMTSSVVQPKSMSLKISSLQRECEHCEAEENMMQRKELNVQRATADNDLENYVGNLSSGGQKLPDDVRSFYEPRFGQDFSGVKVHSDTVAAKSAQSINALAYTNGNNIVFNQGQYSPGTDAGKKLLAHELTHVVQQGGASSEERLLPKIQRQEDEMQDPEPDFNFYEILDQPVFKFEPIKSGAGSADIQADDAESAGGCRPSSMRKVVSGPFEGGFTMDSYYPDLTGGGYYDHPGSGGTFNTGTRVGANAQLIGTFPSPCEPGNFSLGQTVTYTRARFDGTTHPKEGIVQDDIAKSGRDASRAPFRQDWLENGYNVSMADPPSMVYSPSSNIEFDRSFETSLAGPDGRASVNWSTSIRIVNGAVTTNTIS